MRLTKYLSGSQVAALQRDWRFWARVEQIAPDTAWRTWLFLGGRGAGKTRAGAEWVSEQARWGKAGSIALIGPTFHDVREVMLEGQSGLRRLADERPIYEASRRRLLWANGAQALCFSAEDPESLRGPQFDAAWADELCVWPRVEETLATLRLGLRLGDDPRLVVTTTPRPIPALKRLLQEPGAVAWRGTTKSNKANLAPGFFESVAARWGASAYGRQELEGELLEDQQGALWTRETIERCIVSSWPEPDQVVIGAHARELRWSWTRGRVQAGPSLQLGDRRCEPRDQLDGRDAGAVLPLDGRRFVAPQHDLADGRVVRVVAAVPVPLPVRRPDMQLDVATQEQAVVAG